MAQGDHHPEHHRVRVRSIGAALLGPEALVIVRISQEATCFVSPAYFDDDDPFADFVVHEVAHIFHNCKRESAGLPSTRRREWLLDVDYRKRETFAYACEAYGRIVDHGGGAGDRLRLASAFREGCRVADERVDPRSVPSRRAGGRSVAGPRSVVLVSADTLDAQMRVAAG